MVDTTCDGRWMEKFMLERLPEKILEVMHKHQGFDTVDYLRRLMGRPPQSYATIQMDNAGGHGRKEDIEIYESGLLDKGFKVNFQPSDSPDLNVLDLGVWRGLQAEVDKLQRDKRNNPDNGGGDKNMEAKGKLKAELLHESEEEEEEED
ncbi:hypothetical protein TrST_g13698 [Triparma strigata]|uniref:Uncharacterized protein n=1 Tax=Triparma strigata TaxID=1606541 RepID=A0A9W7BV99_9STRA|nr:hypothetical protein TrST_g13698 [Triparma strigata]